MRSWRRCGVEIAVVSPVLRTWSPGSGYVRAGRRREQLLDAALDVFAGKGIDGASVKDIAQAAQVTPGLLYHYFSGKEALVAALLDERGFLADLERVLADVGDRPAVEVLPELVHAVDRLLAENTKLVSLFLAASHANEQAHAALEEFVARGHQLLSRYLQARVEAGELCPHRTRTAVTALFASIAIGRKTGPAIDVDELVDMLLSGLMPRADD